MSSEDLGGLGGLENDKDLKELILSEQQNMQFQQQVKMRNKTKNLKNFSLLM